MNKVKIDQAALLSAVTVASKAIGTHTVLPVLQNILFSFSGDNATLFATNLELGIQTSMVCEGVEEFDMTVPAKIFIELLNTMPGQKISLEFEEADQTLTVKGERSKNKIKCLPADDFPPIPKHDEGKGFTIKTEEFKKTISRILFAASDEEQKPVLKSAIFSVENDTIVIYATDGFRASLRTLVFPKKKLGSYKIIIPSLAVSEASKIFSGEQVSFSFSKNSVTMLSGNTTVFSQLVSGKAPDHTMIEKLIETIEETTVKAGGPDLLNLCKQANIFASKDEHKTIELDFSSKSVTVFGNAQEIGSSTGSAVIGLKGEPVKISLSSEYLREFLSASASPFLTIKMSGPKKPVVFYVEDLPGYWHMLMPIVQ